MEQSYTSLSSGIVVRSVLAEQLDIPVYPVVATEDATPPFAIYQRLGMRTEKTKVHDGIDTCSMAISVYTEDYNSGMELIEAIRRLFESRWWSEDMDDGSQLRLDCSQVTDCGEDWVDDCYSQSITLEFKTNVSTKLNRQ